jgi:hypothetical protein
VNCGMDVLIEDDKIGGEKGIEPSAPALRILKGHFGEDIALLLVSRFV